MRYQRISLIFPGQGSQYVGMGKEFYDHFQAAREVFDQANEILGFDLASLCFKKPGLGRKLMHRDDLNKTINTQPAVLTADYAAYLALMQACREAGLSLPVGFLGGHSLGEYMALVVGGAMRFETALRLVHKRATYMTEVGESYPDAGLMAIVDRKADLNFKWMARLCEEHQVYMALKNTKRQVVVGGPKKHLHDLGKQLKEKGKSSTMLRVEGPFHTPIMKPAADRFWKELEASPMRIASTPIIANVSSEAIVDPIHIRKELYEQIFNVVDWKSGVEKMAENGADLFIEVGPKKVLSNMIKAIDDEIPQLNVEDMASLEATLKALQT